MLITLFRVASSSLRLRSRKRLTGVDGFFATIRGSASALFCERCQPLRRCQFISCFTSGCEFLCFLLLGPSLVCPLMLHMWRELNRVSILGINPKSSVRNHNLLAGALVSVR